ncbi:MAG: exonuclease SbcCD subunit D [Oribacterium sp.]|nr:exonuclease SbcCD subunit D [Oribacterium sp.]
MKFLHLADLHLGKRVNEFSMLEDQKEILRQIISITDEEKPDGMLIAGDIYDKPVPPQEAVQLFDEFLYQMSKRKRTDGSALQVFIISGNHDSAERIAFGSRLMDRTGIHLSPVYNGTVQPFCMQDRYGDVRVFLLPFIKPGNVRAAFPEEAEEIVSYTDAVRTAVRHMDVNASDRNVIVTHQFVTGAVRSESEEVSVGGLDNVDASVFQAFDYVALGHIHGPQTIGCESVRYSGTPLKYSFSEVKQQKSVSIVELLAKGTVRIRTRELVPVHEMREIRGRYAELTARQNYAGTQVQDYLHITLTDEMDIPDAIGKLRTIYPNLMKLDYDNQRTRMHQSLELKDRAEHRSPLELFREFYKRQNNQEMSEEQRNFMKEMIESIWENES